MSRVTYTNTPDRGDQVQLRAAHGVRLVDDSEEGTGVDALPDGVYGYTYSPGLPNAPLFAARRYRSYEVHKVAGGETFVVAYADAATVQQMATASGDVTVLVQPEAAPDATLLVTVPYSRIRRHRQHAAPNQDGFLATLGPVSTGRAGSLDHSDHEPA
jgi:hypothetical protein